MHLGKQCYPSGAAVPLLICSYSFMHYSQNVYGNKMAPSKDIAHSFAVLNSIYFTYSGGMINSERYASTVVALSKCC